jgi:stringent starvation protein B
MATSPSLASWLVDHDDGHRVVIDVPPGGVEVPLREAHDCARQVLELVAMATGPRA